MSNKDKLFNLPFVEIVDKLSKNNKFIEEMYNIVYIPSAPKREHIVFKEGEFKIEKNVLISSPLTIELDRVVKLPDLWMDRFLEHRDIIEPGSTVCIYTTEALENIVCTYSYPEFIKIVHFFKRIYSRSEEKLKKSEISEDIDIITNTFSSHITGVMPIEIDMERQTVTFSIDYYTIKY